MEYQVKAYHRMEQPIDYTNVIKLTHIIYGFAEINLDTFRLFIPNLTDFETFLTEVRAIAPNIKIILSIGGWAADGFSQVAKNSTHTTNFANDCQNYITTYNLDGIDIDWEFPVNGGWGAIASDPADGVNYITLLTSIKNAIGSKELSVASGNYPLFCSDINIAHLNAVVDYINVQNYEFSNGVTFHNNLYMSDTLRNEEWGDRVIKRYITAGADRSKLVYGMGIYGKEWQPGGNWNAGEHLYTELQNDYIEKNGWIRIFDYSSMNPILTNELSEHAIYYEDQESVLYKCDYVKKEHLAGVMYWRYEIDSEVDNLLTIMHNELTIRGEDMADDLTTSIYDVIYGELATNLRENCCIEDYNDNYDNMCSIHLYTLGEQTITFDTTCIRRMGLTIRVRDLDQQNAYFRARKILNKFKKYTTDSLIKFSIFTKNDIIPSPKDKHDRMVYTINFNLTIIEE